MKIGLGILLITGICLTNIVSAQQTQQGLKLLDIYKAHYGQRWTSLVSGLENRSDLSFAQKLAHYEQQIGIVKQQFSKERIQEYQQQSITLKVEHKCKGRPSGTAKNCGFKCVERPNENMYTTEKWVIYTGDEMGKTLNEAKACLKLEVRGAGKNEGTVSATYKYRPSYIDYKVADDADILFKSFLAQ
ncbi:MAG: hypothetical protein ACI9QV_000488 [Methylophagaceae bacterium]|jgi:hypothetical protein